MGFFSIIETFFFISLGITIILVALLVYHFKERLSSIEQKYESLFDIVADVVKQLSNIQSAGQHRPPELGQSQGMGQFGRIYEPWTVSEHLGNVKGSQNYPNNIFNTTGEQELYNPIQKDSVKSYNDIDTETNNSQEYDFDDSDESDNESNKSDGDESDGNESDGDESDGNESDDNKSKEKNHDFSKVIVSDDEVVYTSSSSVNSVKIISLNVAENETKIEEPDITPINLDDTMDIDDTYESPLQDIHIDYSLSTEQEEPPIVIKKVDDNQNEPADTTFVIERTSVKELYKRMSLSNMKATVISKGLCSDPSKLKKNELLKLLEDE